MKIRALLKKKMQAAVKCNPDSPENTLFAGPWIGEFGWELFCWQGYLRARSREFDRVIIASRPAMAPLYADFCDEFIPYDSLGVGVSGYHNLGHTEWPDISERRAFREYLSGKFDIGYNRHYPSRGSREFQNQEFVKYGRKCADLSYDLVLHVRQTGKNHSAKRNGWEPDVWQLFLDALLREEPLSVCCIGDPQNSGLLDGCTDLRGLPVDRVCDLLAGSRLLAGPSSGPMHLGSLCGCPHVVWSGDLWNRVKYEKYWNPFRTPVKYIEKKDWKPPVEQVVREVRNLLEKTA
jgi:hypothetical protein